MLSKKAFSTAMAMLANSFERFEKVVQDDQKMLVWYKFLEDMDDGPLMDGVMSYVRTCKYAPTVAEIRERALALQEPTLSAEEAWGILVRDVRRLGFDREPVYPDWRMEGAKNSIGWGTVCDMTEDTKAATRAHFMRIYQSYENRERMTSSTKSPVVKQFASDLADKLTRKEPQYVKLELPGETPVFVLADEYDRIKELEAGKAVGE